MDPEASALEAFKTRKAVQRDREALVTRFEGVDFEELGPQHRQRAFERLDAFLVASDPVAVCPLADSRSVVTSFDIDEDHAIAIRFAESASGAWFAMSDPGPVLRSMEKGGPEGLALYDCDADVLYVVHEAEYQWESYEIR